ncbi:MAG TPA: carbohydrate kinase [Planctomycetaceae bacterium]
MTNGRFTIVGLGELLWDLFPDGPRFGGAPANFACHAAALGADAFLVSSVGRDELGRKGLAELTAHGVQSDCVTVCDAAPTGTVDVTLDAAGKARFTFAADVAWDHLQWSDALEHLAGRCAAVCFGTLAQRSDVSRQTIRRFVQATPPPALRIFDINLRPPFYDESTIRESLALANVLKLNDEELPMVASLCGVAGTDAEIMARLAMKFDLAAVALTRGGHGALIWRQGELSDAPGQAVVVRDTVGAGDAFTADLSIGLLRHDDLDDINRRACEVAAYVCSCAGATPPLPDEIRRQFVAL